MSSLATLEGKLRDAVKIDPNDRVWSLSVKDAAINRAYFQVQKDGNFDWPENFANHTFQSVPGTQEYSKPSDFIRLDLVRFDGNYLEKREKTELKMVYASGFVSGVPNEYYLYGSYVGLNPIPDSAKTVDVDYRKRLPTITSSQDSLLPSDFDEAIAKYAAYVLFQQVRNTESAKNSLADYASIMDTLRSAYIHIDSFDLRFGIRRPYVARGYRQDALYR